MLPVKPHATLSALGNTFLLLQPFLTFPIFLSVLLGVPPLWLSWLIAILPWTLRLFITRRLTCRTPFDIPILLLTAGMLVGFFLSPDHQLSWSVIHTYLACVLFYYGLANNNRARLGYWVSITVFLCLVLFFLTISVFVGGNGRHVVFNSWAYELGSSVSWPLDVRSNANALGGALAVVVPTLTAIAIFRQERRVKWSAGILATFFSAILLLSASGGGWIAAIVGMFIVVLFYSTKAFWGTFLASAVAVGATFPVWHNAIWVEDVFPTQSILNRVERWQTTVVALKESPLGGLGLGGWWNRVPAYDMPGGPHNAYLELYADTGAIGVIALVATVILGVKLLRRILHADKDNHAYGIAAGIIAGLVAGGIHALLDDNMFVLIPIGSDYLYFAVPLLWIWAALLVMSCQHLLRSVKKDKEAGISSGWP